MNKQLGWAALVLCALCAALIAGLTALHDTVPDVLNLLAIGALTGGASLAVPGQTETVRTSASSPAAAAPARPASAPAAARVPAQPSAAVSTPVGA